MTKKNSYNYQYPIGDQKIIRKLSNPKYEGGNIALSEDADEIEKIKYSISQGILNYHLETKKPLAVMAKEIALADITEKKLYDICRGKINDFHLGELVVSALNLRIYFVPCLDCGGNVLSLLLGDVVRSLKEQEGLPTKIPNIYQALEKHQVLVHKHL
jgi:hypothetical protein